jgi:hypothetical protein
MVVMHIALQSKTSMSCLWATIRCINIVMTLVVTLCRNNRPTRSSNAISQLDPLVLKHDGDGAVNNDPVRKTRPVFAFPDRCARAVHSKSFPMNVLALFFLLLSWLWFGRLTVGSCGGRTVLCLLVTWLFVGRKVDFGNSRTRLMKHLRWIPPHKTNAWA